MGKEGNICSERDAFGFKVAHTIKYPQDFVIEDDVGGNVSKKGDSHAGGTRLTCEKGLVPKKVASNQDNHFSLLGFLALTGVP